MNPTFRTRVVACLLAVCGSLGATMTTPLTLEQMVQRSDVIIQGRYLRSWAAWDDGHQFIWTHSEIEVTDPLKGSPGATVVVSELGGIVGDVGMSVAGMPRYRPGEEMVLFLYQTPIGYWRARGLTQGKFTVRTDAAGGQRVRANLQSAVLVSPSGVAPQPGTVLRRLDNLSLQEFKSTVRNLALQQAKGAK